MNDNPPPRVLAIAGSDSSGGAGIQADIKTITMLGGYAMTAITAVTAQNTVGVQGVEVLPPEFVGAQIDSCLTDIGADAVKIGMLGSAPLADVVWERLSGCTDSLPIVFDPVMVATSGATLADAGTVAAFARLMDVCAVATPNLPELEVLTGNRIRSIEEMQSAAMALAERHGCHILAKGGHSADKQSVTDVLVAPDGRSVAFKHHRIDTRHTHGSGCTLSSAIATLLGHGQGMEHAVRLARQFVFKAIQAAPGFGRGGGPMGHGQVR